MGHESLSRAKALIGHRHAEKGLIDAIKIHDNDLALALIDLGVNVNARIGLPYLDSLEASALEIACQSGNMAMLERLIEKNATASGRELYFATRNRHPQIIKMLLEYNNSKINESIDMCLKLAVIQNDTMSCKYLLEYRGDPNSIITEPFKVIMLQLKPKDGGYRLNCEKDLKGKILGNASNSLLIEAARLDNTDMVNLLLNHHANPNAFNLNGGTALMKAARHGNNEMVHCLIEQGADNSLRAHNQQEIFARHPVGIHTHLIPISLFGNFEELKSAKSNNAGYEYYSHFPRQHDYDCRGIHYEAILEDSDILRMTAQEVAQKFKHHDTSRLLSSPGIQQVQYPVLFGFKRTSRQVAPFHEEHQTAHCLIL